MSALTVPVLKVLDFYQEVMENDNQSIDIRMTAANNLISAIVGMQQITNLRVNQDTTTS